jgi:hypothetical protein
MAQRAVSADQELLPCVPSMPADGGEQEAVNGRLQRFVRFVRAGPHGRADYCPGCRIASNTSRAIRAQGAAQAVPNRQQVVSRFVQHLVRRSVSDLDQGIDWVL